MTRSLQYSIWLGDVMCAYYLFICFEPMCIGVAAGEHKLACGAHLGVSSLLPHCRESLLLF